MHQFFVGDNADAVVHRGCRVLDQRVVRSGHRGIGRSAGLTAGYPAAGKTLKTRGMVPPRPC